MYATRVNRSLFTKGQSVKSAFNINLNPVDEEKFNLLSTFFYKEVRGGGLKIKLGIRIITVLSEENS
jgi:hypothetical protein